MKKITTRLVTTALILTLCAGAALPALASNDPTPRIRIDGEFVYIPSYDQSPVIIDGRTLVPVRAVMEALGFEVQWLPYRYGGILCENGGGVRITRNCSASAVEGALRAIGLSIGSQTISYGRYPNIGTGLRMEIDVPAQLINSRIMVPVRAIAELTGFTVTWDGSNFIVDISTGGQIHPPQQPPTQQQPLVGELDRIIPVGRPATASMGNVSEWANNFTATEFELALFERVNQFREENGKVALPWCNEMAARAALRTSYLVNSGFVRADHQSGDAHTWGSFTTLDINRTFATSGGFGFNFWGNAIGNATTIEQLADNVVATWSNSTIHRQNMLGQRWGASYMGVGSAVTEHGVIYVYLFPRN